MAKKVVVTGCSRGIGKALALGFLERGIEVAGCSRQLPDIPEFQSEPFFRSLDVKDDHGMNLWAQQLSDQGFTPDLVIANAGILNVRAPLWEISAQEFGEVIDINVKGVHHTFSAFLPAMLQRKSGVLVGLSSGWGRSTSPEVGPYCASKFAVEGLVGSLAQELPHGMAAVALSPGVVHTEMLCRAFGSSEAAHAVEPEEWARSAVDFLLELGASDSGRSLSFQR
ncbi:MAG: hypothetical protein CBC13_04715 [Planctomycetia bacterium TMED53]|nr:MAG: hypothetical protein CBC13_04715 [Planctomycetia bacterium TMED53]